MKSVEDVSEDDRDITIYITDPTVQIANGDAYDFFHKKCSHCGLTNFLHKDLVNALLEKTSLKQTFDVENMLKVGEKVGNKTGCGTLILENECPAASCKKMGNFLITFLFLSQPKEKGKDWTTELN